MVRDPSSAVSLTQDAYQRLRADLLTCRLRPGTRLKINDLCRTLSVSLSAVREALSRLTSEGLVVAEPQRGFRATPISAAELCDITQVRIQIEWLCLEQSIAKGDIAWEAQLVAALHRLSRTPERDPQDPTRMNDQWSLVHAAYHEALASACDSVWLLRLREILYVQSERYRRLSIPLADVARDLMQEHQALMDAALARDVRRARELLTQHIELTTRILLEQDWAGTDVETIANKTAGRTAAKPSGMAMAVDRRRGSFEISRACGDRRRARDQPGTAVMAFASTGAEARPMADQQLGEHQANRRSLVPPDD